MRFVSIKTQEQLDVQAMHRVRDRLVQRRTALINEIPRGIEEVVLVGFAIRLHKLRRDESHLVPLLAQGGSQEVRSLTGFQTDQ